MSESLLARADAAISDAWELKRERRLIATECDDARADLRATILESAVARRERDALREDRQEREVTS